MASTWQPKRVAIPPRVSPDWTTYTWGGDVGSAAAMPTLGSSGTEVAVAVALPGAFGLEPGVAAAGVPGS